MKYISFCIAVITAMLFSCKSSKNTPTTSQIEAFNALVSSRNYTIESNWAQPQLTAATAQVLSSGLLPPESNAGAINLVGNSNFFTIKGDSITSYLPFFGERQMQVAYNGSDSAIQFNGLMQDYEEKFGKNNRKIISFNARSINLENFNVVVVLFPNMKSQIILNGTSRFTIRYSGEVSPIDETENQS